MSKTPKELAEEYCNQFSWNDPREEDAHNAFLAGYNYGRLLTTQEITQCAEMAAWSNPRFSLGTLLFPLGSFLLGMLIRGWL